MAFTLALLGSTIGLGNFMRFPYLCNKYGGAIFFLPYCMVMVMVGFPMLLLELALGQMLQKGAVNVWRYLNPKMVGIGYSTLVCCFITSLYYCIYVAYSLLIFITGFLKPLPWYSDEGRSEIKIPRGQNGTVTVEIGEARYPDCKELGITNAEA